MKNLRLLHEYQIIRAWLKDKAAQVSGKRYSALITLARSRDLRSTEVAATWLRKHLEILDNADGLRAWLEDVIHDLENDEHMEAHRRGELDDLLYTAAERRRMEVP